MARSVYVLAAILAASSVPALGAVTVIGNSNARLCFEAADSPMQPTMRDLRLCDEAFAAEEVARGRSIVGLYPATDASRTEFQRWRQGRDGG